MEPLDIAQLKLFAGGFFLGYLSGFIIRKGIKLFIVLAIFLAVIIHLTGMWESLATAWSFIGGFLIKFITSVFASLKDMVGVQMTGNTFLIGFLAGLGWSLC